MTFYNPFDDPNYCGYCKCSPCQCDGHGNFGEQENVSWYPKNLDVELRPQRGDRFDFHPEDRPRFPSISGGYHQPSQELQKERAERNSERPQLPLR